MSELVRTTLAIERDLLEKFDRWMASHGYTNRSEAVRDVMRNSLIEDQWANPKGAVVATLTIIYDHGSRLLAQSLTEMQHEDHHAVMCSQHVHLSHDRCLEVILLRGSAEQLRRLADTMVAARGVLAGKLTLMSEDV